MNSKSKKFLCNLLFFLGITIILGSTIIAINRIQNYKEQFYAENTNSIVDVQKPNPLIDNNIMETPINERIVYEGASTPFTPVGTILSKNTGSFIYE